MQWTKLSDSLSWTQGHSGKGYLLHDGTIKTWNLDPFRPEDQHQIWERNRELSPIALNFDIDPDGGVVTDAPTTKVESIVAADPRLYDAGQRPVFEDDFDLDKFEPEEKPDGKPDFNLIMSAWEWPWELPENGNYCPRCHEPKLDYSGHCQGCGYVLPYDGAESDDGALDTRPGAPYLHEPNDMGDVWPWAIEFGGQRQGRVSASSFVQALMALRPAMASAAQAIYDEWQDSEDDDFGGGGICDAIADEVGSIIAQNIADVDIRDGGWEGDDHAYVIATLGGESVAVDIPSGVYETGGGYSWTKVPDVTFTPDDVAISSLGNLGHYGHRYHAMADWSMHSPEEFRNLDYETPTSGSHSPKGIFDWRDQGEIDGNTLYDYAHQEDPWLFEEILGKRWANIRNSEGVESGMGPYHEHLIPAIKRNDPITVHRIGEPGEGPIMPGAYVTESPEYAQTHARGQYDGVPYEHHTLEVRPSELYSYGDPHEFLYAPEDVNEAYQRYQEAMARAPQGIQRAASWHLADGPYGYTNYATSSTILMIQNTREWQEAARQIVLDGGTPQQLADWTTRVILGPFNREQIADAQSWNTIPQEERLDYNYESFKDKHGDDPKAMDLYHNFVGGPDIEDMDPNIIDPELVNWQEIYDEIYGDLVENDMLSPAPQQPMTFPQEWTSHKHALTRPHEWAWQKLKDAAPEMFDPEAAGRAVNDSLAELAPAVELREWLADLGGAEPISPHHETEDDFISAPQASTADDLPYFPPANVPKEYKQSVMQPTGPDPLRGRVDATVMAVMHNLLMNDPGMSEEEAMDKAMQWARGLDPAGWDLRGGDNVPRVKQDYLGVAGDAAYNLNNPLNEYRVPGLPEGLDLSRATPNIPHTSASPVTSWHLTDNPQFALDPEYVPEDNSLSLRGGGYGRGLFVGDPSSWFNHPQYHYTRPFVAEIEHPADALQSPGWGQFLPASAFPQSRVRRVIPTDEYYREKYREPGPIESHLDPDDDIYEPLLPGNISRRPKKLPDYRYQGPDVREMSPEEIAHHTERTTRYFKDMFPEAFPANAMCPRCRNDQTTLTANPNQFRCEECGGRFPFTKTADSPITQADATNDPLGKRSAEDPRVMYHGTHSGAMPEIDRCGLVGQGHNGVFVTDSLKAAQAYAQEIAKRRGTEPVVYQVEIPPVTPQPNGTPAPPYFLDDWHRDSGMPGQGYEYDRDVPPDRLRRIANIKQADSPITQADATNDPLGKNPAIIPSRQGDPDYLQVVNCPHCQKPHRPDQPCGDSAVGQYKQQQRAWYGQDPNAAGPGPGPNGLHDQQMDMGKSSADNSTKCPWCGSSDAEPMEEQRPIPGYSRSPWQHTEYRCGQCGQRFVPGAITGIPHEEADPQAFEHPDPMMDNEPGSLKLPPNWSSIHPRPDDPLGDWGTDRGRTSAWEPFTFPTGRQAEVDYENNLIREPGEEPQTLDDFMQDTYYRRNLSDYVDPPDPHEEFWRDPYMVFHGTDEENIPSILEHGLQPRDKTRGIDNRFMGPAIFTSPDPSTAEYHYGPTLAIDAPRMKADGYTPTVGTDAYDEINQREALAHALGLDDWYEDSPTGGEAPDTVVFHQPIPPQYITRYDPRMAKTADYDHEDSLIGTATTMVDMGSDIDEAAQWLERALQQSGRPPQEAQAITDEVFMRRGHVESAE